ncbi:MAG: hypothetical protein ACOCV1_08625 [Bacillota bacterium]
MYYEKERLISMLNNHINMLSKTLESDLIVNTEDREMIKKDILEEFMTYLYNRTHYNREECWRKKKKILKTNEYVIFKYRDFENKISFYGNYHAAKENEIVDENLIAKIYEWINDYAEKEYSYDGAFNGILVDIEEYLLWSRSPIKYKKVRRNPFIRLYHQAIDKILGRKRKEMILY